MSVPSQVTVVGAGAAGLSVAEGPRREGFTGRVALLGEEEHLPYDRPPLSKQLLTGAWGPDRLPLRSRDDIARLDLQLRLVALYGRGDQVCGVAGINLPRATRTRRARVAEAAA
ncbi:FAD-dependent oxidoreductase [Streptomyces phaeochromogenes]|uniref:FAD-dependent oxidoreductase n=1 Tax=Streptomyces phaeochromogenes TaxID=1923 RepID=UPI0036778840